MFHHPAEAAGTPRCRPHGVARPATRRKARFALRPCAVRRGRAVAGRRGRGGGCVVPAAGGRGCPSVGLLAVGVCCVCSVSLCRFRSGGFGGAAFGPLSGRAVGRFRLGSVIPPFAALAVRVCRGRAVFLVRRRVALRAVLGSALAAAPRLLRGACGGRWVCGFRAGVPVLAALSLRPSSAAGRSCGLAVRSLPLFPSAAPVAVGCAPGADAFVRSAAPGALVFSVAAFGAGRGAFAARSVALVRAVAAGGSGSGFVVFPSAPCPVELVPSRHPSACFCGLGSGSWASAAFTAGLGVPLVVFPCGFSGLPAWGHWVSAGSGVWAVGFVLR